MLLELIYCSAGEVYEGIRLIEDEEFGTSRWSQHMRLVVQDEFTGKFYCTSYSKGLTEIQDESPFEYAPDDVEMREVFPVQKTITVYE